MPSVELSEEWQRAICLEIMEANERRKGGQTEYV